jgi:hypothetical protein
MSLNNRTSLIGSVVGSYILGEKLGEGTYVCSLDLTCCRSRARLQLCHRAQGAQGNLCSHSLDADLAQGRSRIDNSVVALKEIHLGASRTYASLP